VGKLAKVEVQRVVFISAIFLLFIILELLRHRYGIKDRGSPGFFFGGGGGLQTKLYGMVQAWVAQKLLTA
jgi:hypothetical protein